MSHVMNTYARQPVAFVRGQGVWLWDEAGKKYLDALAGIAVNTLGYGHPKLKKALIARVESGVLHTSNLWRIPDQEAAADRIAEITGLDEVFFCNSGLEANEAAIKIARKYGHERGVAEPAIIVMEKAFHGRSLATLSATGSRKVQAGFEPLVSGFVRVPLNDLEAVRQVAEHNKNVVAVFVEPIQGEGGINVSRLEYLRGLKEICERKEWLFMSDEVQCGLGRTGRMFAFQHAGVVPDILTLAKPLGGGLPMGAVLVREELASAIAVGDHGSTFGGNPVAAAASLAVLDRLSSPGFIEGVARRGASLARGLRKIGRSHPALVAEVRGLGLMLGLELKTEAAPVVKALRQRGFLATKAGDKVLRLLPPLVVKSAEIKAFLEALDLVLNELGADASKTEGVAAR